MKLLATYRKNQFRIGQKFLFLVTKKRVKIKNDLLNRHRSCHWCFHYCIPFLLALSLKITFFKLITYSLRSSAFICLTLIFYLSYQDQASAFKMVYIFKVFGTQNCLMVAQQFDQITYVWKEYNNFEDSKLIAISDFKIFPIMLLRQLNCGVLSVLQLFYV